MTAAIKSNAASFRAAAGILCWLCVCMILYSHASAAGDRKYIGSETCADCHPAEYDSWRGSHHDLAMQPANSETVLGDFDNTEFNHFGVTSTFYREGDRFLVRTDGADGSLQDFEISYTFGVHPLQQYLVEIPGGRMQALSIAWDSRSAAAGGQRWFHLYECHSTELQKNYDAAKRSFDTKWSEVNVACEACHGPGADHQVWAKRGTGWQQLEASRGLAVLLDERRGVHWQIDAGASIARRSQPRESARPSVATTVMANPCSIITCRLC